MYSKIINYYSKILLNTMASSRHEADKENVHRTRIPLPKDPLPALPKRLLEEAKKNHTEPQRGPLKTLNAQSIPKAGPSKMIPHKQRHFAKMDTRHVTIRQRDVDLDWHYTVFRDENVDKDASVISISDDEKYLDNKESRQHFVENKRKNTLGAALTAGTPNLKACLEPNRVKNIKRSLKRPHSRELQGLSPAPAARQEKIDDKVKRRLQFNESIQDRLGTPDFWKRSYMRCLNRDYTKDVFDYLLAVECKPIKAKLRTSSVTRACVINWLMTVHGVDGNPSVIQSACWYLDSILGTIKVESKQLHLLAAACFWIAQKLYGPFMPATRLVKHSNWVFTPEMLRATEKAVLISLLFPRQPVVAQDYITYLSWWCDTHNAGEIEVAATFLAMCGLMVDRALSDEYPSVIAAAAIRNALLLLRKKDLIPRLQLSHVFQAAEKKATSMSYTCSILRRAVRTVADPIYEYKTPFEHYSMPPCFIAQRIIKAANDFSVIDARNTDRN